jgi:hypothetical protein
MPERRRSESKNVDHSSVSGSERTWAWVIQAPTPIHRINDSLDAMFEQFSPITSA